MKNGPYILVVAPADYPGIRYRGKYCYEHHLVYWRYYGIVPGSSDVVHHKNHDKHDNWIENLELMSRKKHDAHHGLEASLAALIHLKCQGCGQEIAVRGNNYRSRKKGNKMGLFCGRSCATKYQFSRYIPS
jgi:hypothetical protein